MKREFSCSSLEMVSLLPHKLIIKNGESCVDVLEQLWKQLEAQRYL